VHISYELPEPKSYGHSTADSSGRYSSNGYDGLESHVWISKRIDLRRVCSTWYHILKQDLTQPSFWTSLAIHLDVGYVPVESLQNISSTDSSISHILERSENLPLDVSILDRPSTYEDSPGYSGLVLLPLLQESQRWKTLKLDVPSNFIFRHDFFFNMCITACYCSKAWRSSRIS